MNHARGGPQVFLDVVLSPHRSLSPRGFLILMLVLTATSFVSGIIFVLNGAWPVFGFFGLDVLLVYFAFKANYRAGTARETLRLTDDDLTLTRINAYGRENAYHFEPHWLRVEMDEPVEHWTPLVLTSHGRRCTVGAFLTVEERVELMNALRAALVTRQQALRFPSGV